MIEIKIKNIAQIKAAFAKAPNLMSKELNTAIRQTTLSIAGESAKRTPVDTGRLRGSTYTRFGNMRGEVGTNTIYDRFVHWGTRYMRARPYLKNAVEYKQNDTNRYFKQAVQRTLDNIGDKI